MAVTNEDSVQMALTTGAIKIGNETSDWHGRRRGLHCDHVQSAAPGDANSTVRLGRIPAGKVRLNLWASRVAHSAFGAARTLNLGWEAYTGSDGVAVVADPNGLDDGVDVSSAGSYTPLGTLGGAESKVFESAGGVVLVAEVEGGTIPAAATVNAFFDYIVD